MRAWLGFGDLVLIFKITGGGGASIFSANITLFLIVFPHFPYFELSNRYLFNPYVFYYMNSSVFEVSEVFIDIS